VKERIAIVTGAASGIGKAVAETLASANHNVVVADLNAAGGQAVADAVGGLFVPVDLANREDCHRLVEAAWERYGTVHILVNNAAFQHIDPIDEFPEDVWDKMLAVLLTAPFLLTRYVWPAMKGQGWGRIVNIGSRQSERATPFKVAYVTAKHGLLGLTKVAALEGGPHGITANAVLPTWTRTALVEKQIADQARTRQIPESEVIERVMLSGRPIRRLLEPEEVAKLVLFLCSDDAAAITGSSYRIDLGAAIS